MIYEERTTVAVIAKDPQPGRVKTRLCPPFSPRAAAELAAAALADTLRAVRCVPAVRRVLVLDGEPGPWVPPEFTVLPQVDGGLARRLDSAFETLGGPTVLVGMDTPQVDPSTITEALRAIADADADAALGMAVDGGFWLVGMRRYHRSAFAGVPMSTTHTGRLQLRRLEGLGWRVASVPVVRDVDDARDAFAVAADAPHTQFARALTRLSRQEAVA